MAEEIYEGAIGIDLGNIRRDLSLNVSDGH